VEQLTLVTSPDDGAVLHVHLPCGATIWFSPGPEPDDTIAKRRCDVCDPADKQAPDGLWRQVWASQPIKK
jgi:hypothetical protein